MGVPQLAPYIFKNYAMYYHLFNHSTLELPPRFSVDNFYIDANALIHNEAQTVYNYGNGVSLMYDEMYGSFSDEELEEECFGRFMCKIRDLVNYISPKKLVYITLDGTAPLAKQAQQRRRRFVSARNPAATRFNTNNLTTGTEYMKRLNKYIDKNISVLKGLKRKVIVFSGQSSPGEGEHKILDFIRERCQFDEEFKNKQSHCIFSPDGDLFMLTLALDVKEIYLFRQGNEPCTFDFLEMSPIKRCVSSGYLNFIFMGVFLGNDFLPKIQMFSNLNDSIKEMISIPESNDLVDPATLTVRWKSFRNFIKRLREREPSKLYNNNLRYSSRDPKFENKTLNNCIVTSAGGGGPVSNGGPTSGGWLNFKKYRELYYQKFASSGGGSGEVNINNICKTYVDTILWNFDYYTRGVNYSSWEIYYPYHYAPLMYDLDRWCTSFENYRVRYLPSRPSTMIEQLVSVLPPSSSDLVPEKFRHLLRGTLDFEIDYEGKFKDYQAITKIEFIDNQNIRSAVSDISTTEDCEVHSPQLSEIIYY